ncbi:MAG TPA: cation transporting ATPase C-terminal domain-containing protein, partial [Candidatus Polarisedimenticolaceae bacterium]|nr:cation transporting ATPase C-terminal domain-containing protein [Candidatus Polarisedimenticolaceae bacterium]
MDLIAAALVLVPEVVIAQCHDLEQARGRAVLADADDLARQGRRVLALARKPIRPTEDLEAQVTAGGYGFVALVAMHDLPRRRDPRGRDLGRPSPDRAGHRPRGGHPGRATRLHPHRRRPRDDVMAMPPRPRTERLLSRRLLLSSYLLWGILESAAGFAAYGFVLLGG